MLVCGSGGFILSGFAVTSFYKYASAHRLCRDFVFQIRLGLPALPSLRFSNTSSLSGFAVTSFYKFASAYWLCQHFLFK
jgi:hypothetical protein